MDCFGFLLFQILSYAFRDLITQACTVDGLGQESNLSTTTRLPIAVLNVPPFSLYLSISFSLYFYFVWVFNGWVSKKSDLRTEPPWSSHADWTKKCATLLSQMDDQDVEIFESVLTPLPSTGPRLCKNGGKKKKKSQKNESTLAKLALNTSILSRLSYNTKLRQPFYRKPKCYSGLGSLRPQSRTSFSSSRSSIVHPLPPISFHTAYILTNEIVSPRCTPVV